MERQNLFNVNYCGREKEKLLFAQYELYVMMADKISHRRAVSNSFFLAINTALISLVNYVEQFHSPIYLLNIAGLILAILWKNIITSYKNLNSAKYNIINQIEAVLPLTPYFTEWQILERGGNKKKYWPVTHIESYVPIIFALIYSWPVIKLLYIWLKAQ